MEVTGDKGRGRKLPSACNDMITQFCSAKAASMPTMLQCEEIGGGYNT
jgi:hypothetical protein